MTTSKDQALPVRRSALQIADDRREQHSASTLPTHQALQGINQHPQTVAAADVLGLQRSIGNRATQQVLARKALGPQPSQVLQRFPVQVESRGAAHTMRGGTSMTAKVGAASEWVYGSGPPGAVPNLMTKVGANIQGKHRYIAGHLLNDNMGGQGVNNNLTVLSSNANKKHRGIEGKVKNLAIKADQINNGAIGLGSAAYDHGARYTVEVLDPAPNGAAPFSKLQEGKIGAGLQISIDPIRIHKGTNVESVWPEEAGGVNDLTDHVIANVPPYPAVPKKKKPTPIQKHIITAIRAAGGAGATVKDIWGYISANIAPTPTKRGVILGLSRGVSTRFFSKRAGLFKVIAKNI